MPKVKLYIKYIILVPNKKISIPINFLLILIYNLIYLFLK